MYYHEILKGALRAGKYAMRKGWNMYGDKMVRLGENDTPELCEGSHPIDWEVTPYIPTEEDLTSNDWIRD